MKTQRATVDPSILSEADSTIAGEWAARYAAGQVLTPEQNLMMAILGAALIDLATSDVRHPRAARIWRDAWRWIFEPSNPRHPFSFLNIADALNFSASSIRAKLRRMHGSLVETAEANAIRSVPKQYVRGETRPCAVQRRQRA